MSNRYAPIAAALVLVGSSILSIAVPVTVEAAAVPKCFGKIATIVGTNKDDMLRGTDKIDVIVALGGDDTVKALAGDDLVCGGSGNDRIYGGPGFDALHGGAGKDQLRGQDGGDDLWGQAGNDALNGGSGFDWVSFADAPVGVQADLSTGHATGDGTDTLIRIEGLAGSHHDDLLVGDTGQNKFEGRGGDDAIDGGGGPVDAVTFYFASGPVTVDLTAGTASGEGIDTLTGIESVHGGSFSDTITGDANTNFIEGGAGNDTISSLVGDDYLSGGAGDDTIDAGSGTDVVDGGPGADSCLNGEDVSNCEP